MIKTETLLDIISGSRADIVAKMTRGLFSALVPIYKAGLTIRNRKFEQGQGVCKVNVPVVSIGNLTTGGTGKTPMVVWVVRYLESISMPTVLLSRGYGRGDNDQNDEAMELATRLPNTPHLQNKHRYESAKRAVSEFDCQAIVLDDGFQHRALHRDLDIVLIDATQPFGFGHLLPRGLLREPLSALCRADAIVLTRCNYVDDGVRQSIRDEIIKHNPDAIWAEATTTATGWRNQSGEQFRMGILEGKEVNAFCGIGNPGAFRQTLEKLGLHLAGFKSFPDHHDYSDADLNGIVMQSLRCDAHATVCTHKDLVKIESRPVNADWNLLALEIETRFVSGGEELKRLIRETVLTTKPSGPDAA